MCIEKKGKKYNILFEKKEAKAKYERVLLPNKISRTCMYWLNTKYNSGLI